MIPKTTPTRFVVAGQWFCRKDLTGFDVAWAKSYMLQGWHANAQGNLVNSVNYEYVPQTPVVKGHRILVDAKNPYFLARIPEPMFQKIVIKAVDAMPEWKKYQTVQINRPVLF